MPNANTSGGFKTAKAIHDLLLNQNVKGVTGSIKLEFMGIEHLLDDKSAIGDLLQAWLGSWLKKNNIYYRTKQNTQEFPDFHLLADEENGLLEVKTFDGDRSANFDVANFEAYCGSLQANTNRLNADYLIFSYTLHHGILKIKGVWLKKIWEICCPSAKYAIKTQTKRDVIYNIRPACWGSERASYKTFQNKKEFVTALHKTLKKYPKTSNIADDWLSNVNEDYLSRNGQSL